MNADTASMVRAMLDAADELDAWDGLPSATLGGVSPGGLVRWALIEQLTPCDHVDALCDICLDSVFKYREEVLRCQYVSPTPWGPSQCALPDGHEERHAYSPSESAT